MEETTAQQDWERFIDWEEASKDTIDFKKVYVDIADDLVAGLMLSQIVYWHLPTEDSSTKLQVEHDDKLWLAKRHQDWYDEIRITAKQAKRALKILEEKEIIEAALYKFDGAPIKHIRIKKEIFLKKIASSPGNYWIRTKALNAQPVQNFNGTPEKNSRESKPRYVYLITDGRFIKIGISKDVETRLNLLQVGNPKELSIITKYKVGKPTEIEEIIHEHYRNKRANSEWFKLPKHDIEVIKKYLSFHSV